LAELVNAVNTGAKTGVSQTLTVVTGVSGSTVTAVTLTIKNGLIVGVA
jgi:hypothetical protein